VKGPPIEDEMTDETSNLGRRITVWTAACGLVGGFLGSGAEGLLKWLEFRQHLSETQQLQTLEVVKLATDLDKNHVAAANDYIEIVSRDLPEEVHSKLVLIVTRQAISGASPNPQVAAQIASAHPQVVTRSPELRALLMSGHPRLFIQIARAEQRTGAEAIRSDAAAAGVNAPGVEVVGHYGGQTELRYFFSQDKEQAVSLARLLQPMLPSLACRQVGGYQQSQGVNPELFELWIGPDAAILTDKQAAPAPVTCA
jgi:hypothetical protein